VKAEREAGEPPSHIGVVEPLRRFKRTVLLISFPGRAKISHPKNSASNRRLLVARHAVNRANRTLSHSVQNWWANDPRPTGPRANIGELTAGTQVRSSVRVTR
jgi:hypothetical protein